MRADILAASIRVLRREGALRFTTPRVAAAAGISVGSLYQYFPNKEALLFALHAQTVERAWQEVQRILDDARLRPRERIRRVARLFFAAEREDVRALGDAELYFAGEPAARALDEVVRRRFVRFLRAALPRRSRAAVERAAALVTTLLESVGKAVAKRPLSDAAVARWADECAAMLGDHLGLG